MQDNANSVRNLVIGMLLVAAPFGLAYGLTRGNPGSEVLLIVAVFCAGLALTFALASGVQRVGAIALRLSGRSSRDIMIVGLAGLSLLTPWTIEVAVGHLPRVFGWTNPLAWVVAICLVLSVMRSARPYQGLALAAAGVAMLAWILWAGWLLSTPGFRFAAGAAREPERATAGAVWRLAMVPGMGLVRLGFAGRGRVWLAAAILAVTFVGISAVNDSEFAYWAHYDTTPPDRGRLDVILAAAALALVLLGSWFDTGRTLRRRAIMGDWLARVTTRSRGGSGQA